MDGLLGSNNLDSFSLLGMSPEDINRAKSQAQSDMYLALANQLFSGGPTGRSIAQGLQMGQQAYKDALQGQLQEKLQTAQIQDMIAKRQEAQAAKQRQAQVQQILGQGYQPAVAGQPAQMVEEDGRYIGETPAIAARPAGFNIQSIAPALMTTPEGRAELTGLLNAQKAMAGESFKLGEGERQFMRNPFTGELTQVATGAEKAKSLKEVDLGSHIALIDPITGAEVMRMPKGRAPEGPVSLQHVETDQGIATFNPRTGQLTPVMQGGKPVMGKGAGNLTESQGNATTYGMRMSQANDILSPLEAAGVKNTGMIRAGVSGTLGAVPLIGDALSKGSDNVFNTLPTILGGLSEDQQSVVQARTNFITAVLRKESGASISPGEYATAEKNYFPAPGDSEKVVKQKQQARETAIKGMKLQAGPGAKFIDQSVPTSSGW